MNAIELKTENGTVLFVNKALDYFWFDGEGDEVPMHPVCEPDEQIYAYSHGGADYRAACRAIGAWKDAQ